MTGFLLGRSRPSATSSQKEHQPSLSAAHFGLQKRTGILSPIRADTAEGQQSPFLFLLLYNTRRPCQDCIF